MNLTVTTLADPNQKPNIRLRAPSSSITETSSVSPDVPLFERRNSLSVEHNMAANEEATDVLQLQSVEQDV